MAPRAAVKRRTVVMVFVAFLVIGLFVTTRPQAPAPTPPHLRKIDQALRKMEFDMAERQHKPEPRAVPPPFLTKATKQPTKDRAAGRVEMQPRNTGCYDNPTRESCCKSIDSRYSIHGPPFFGGSPCMPSRKGTVFKDTGNKCEPEAWALLNDPENTGSCDSADDLEEESLAEVIEKQKLKRQRETSSENAHDLNLMWVTDCKPSMEWSSVLLLWSALHVKQPGSFTRIATGCETVLMRKFVTDAMSTVSEIFDAQDRVTVHFAPKHITDERDGTNGEVYTPYTKAFGVKHFLDHARPSNRVAVILDPDFLFNRPFEYRMDQVEAHRVIPATHTREWSHDVSPGKPVGQLYGLGAGWKHPPYNLTEICGENSPCTKVSEPDAWRYFTMGPPIFMTIDDWIKVAQGWYDYLPIIRRKNKDWMEEMRSYTMSAAHNEQKTAIFAHFMISDKSNQVRDEGWPWIEQNENIPDICRDGKTLNVVNYPEITDPYPPILHYCSAYEPEYYGGHYFWSKYQINFGIAQVANGNILDCDQPLYEDPPRDLLEAQQFGLPQCLSQRRQAWMLCQVQYALNDCLVEFKKQKCGEEGYNKARTAKHQFDPRPSKVDHPPECRKQRP
eukprot:TRINITY_DN3052_c0_g1_i1.p1 TRINITY_DN3052_c0_g1~~TRINITY_DN3052_c0_g1_i1.p1  ORF type:complete len:615 (-),score=107.05 TRINITY_DN3052_c0_g1_i1:180-2024(-)